MFLLRLPTDLAHQPQEISLFENRRAVGHRGEFRGVFLATDREHSNRIRAERGDRRLRRRFIPANRYVLARIEVRGPARHQIS